MNPRQTLDFVKFSGLDPDVVVARLKRFGKIEEQLSLINEEECNLGTLSELSQRREKLLMSEAASIATMLGCKLHHQGDPRGAAIRLIRPDGCSNNFDGETWYVELEEDQ